MSDRDRFEVVGRRRVPPDPGLTAALSSGHVFTTAIADIIDNSRDALATIVHVRVVLKADRLHRILIGDDGHGMDSNEIDAAMSLGRPKTGRGPTLGYFGVGLKAASFSQADTLTVLTHRDRAAGEGRQMHRLQAEGFVCDVLDRRQVEEELASPLPGLSADRGTFVRWDDLRKVPRGGRVHTDDRLANMQNDAFRHLGIVFHRFLDAGELDITWDVLDEDIGETGPVRHVKATDPFGHHHAGRRGYPINMTAAVFGRAVPLRCTIWPARSESPGFQIGPGNADAYQGLYVYRNGRLLSYGGWHDVTSEHRRRRLARVEVDMTGFDDLVQMSAEKDSVDLSSDLVTSIAAASDGHGTTFMDFIADAEAVFVESNTRTRRLTPVLPPGAGIDPAVKRTVADEAVIHEGKPPLDIRWTDFGAGDDHFIEIDRKQGVVWLNACYRSALLDGRRGRLNDLPMVKTLLYLLYEDVMGGTAIGPKERAMLDYWDAVLTAAATAEESSYRDQ